MDGLAFYLFNNIVMHSARFRHSTAASLFPFNSQRSPADTFGNFSQTLAEKWGTPWTAQTSAFTLTATLELPHVTNLTGYENSYLFHPSVLPFSRLCF